MNESETVSLTGEQPGDSVPAEAVPLTDQGDEVAPLRGDGDVPTQESFIARDLADFQRRHPEVDLRQLDADSAFHRFCGSRYGRESLSDLYEDYMALDRAAQERALAREQRRRERSTAAGHPSAQPGLSPSEQRALDEWNRAYPRMRMTAREFRER